MAKWRMNSFFWAALLMVPAAAGADEPWARAEANAAQSQRAIQFCRRYAHGWLAQADGQSGLLPRTLRGDGYWNAKDCAADNFPFLVLTAHVTDDYHLKRAADFILAQEQQLCNRLDSLPDDFLFTTQRFRTEAHNLDSLIFGAAEYAKDGLMPVTEWLGPGPFADRMQQLIRDIFKHAPHEGPTGKLPSKNVEVNGELMQVISRLYWMTGDEQYRDWAFRLADYYLEHVNLLEQNSLRLRDHGSEIVGGLSEACLLASYEDPPRWERYRPRMLAILDRILEVGVNPDGLMFNVIDPKAGTVTEQNLSDSWGYVYNAFYTIATIAGEPRYQDAIARALANLHQYKAHAWEGPSADGYADSIESALNLLNRLPTESAFAWVDEEIQFIFNKQRPDGVLEGWYGDGNSARTALMYALWKTQGVAPAPWRDDLRVGAVPRDDGSLALQVSADWAWTGRLRFDRRRHHDFFHMPADYPRINQFPEWFVVAPLDKYEVTIGVQPARIVAGHELHAFPLSLKPGESVQFVVRPWQDPAAPPRRTMRYTPRSAEQARAWQAELRERLFELLKLADLRANPIAPQPRVLSTENRPAYTMQEVEINATAGRRIKVLVTRPKTGQPPFPAIVCIHGHGGSRHIVYDRASVYRGFADELASAGFVTLSADVGQHEVYEAGHTLMGERLWDLMRCADYLAGLEHVDVRRMGCAGLSLGGEMAMWLGAMDERMAATFSSGFLTVMDQMERDHCLCWKLDGLRELVDFADIYALTAPRALLCQNGLAEPLTGFSVPLAREALREIRPIYADLGRPDGVRLAVHPGGHEIDLSGLAAFFAEHLKGHQR